MYKVKTTEQLFDLLLQVGCDMKTRFGIHKFKNRCCCYSCRPIGSRGLRNSPVFGRSFNPIPTKRADYAHHISTCPLPPEFQTFWQPWVAIGINGFALIYLFINRNWKCRFRKNMKKNILPKIKHRWHLILWNCHHTKLISKLLLFK